MCWRFLTELQSAKSKVSASLTTTVPVMVRDSNNNEDDRGSLDREQVMQITNTRIYQQKKVKLETVNVNQCWSSGVDCSNVFRAWICWVSVNLHKVMPCFIDLRFHNSATKTMLYIAVLLLNLLACSYCKIIYRTTSRCTVLQPIDLGCMYR